VKTTDRINKKQRNNRKFGEMHESVKSLAAVLSYGGEKLPTPSFENPGSK
jgi:hypothetical protein